MGRDPFNQNSDRSDREKRTTSKGGPVFSKLFRLDRTDPLSFGPKFPEILVEWIAPMFTSTSTSCVLWKYPPTLISDGMPDMCPKVKVTINEALSFSDVRNIAYNR